jgi:hypothetical protein
MTDDPMVALSKWESMVRASDSAIRSMPERSMLTVQLDDLVALDREASFARLVEFLEIDDETPMRRYFDRRISAEAAHVGRWRLRMAPQDARRVDRRYRKVVRRLHRDGVSWVSPPEDGGVRLGPLRIPTPAR